MPKSNSFEEQYPYINRFVEERGWIEIGQSEHINSFVRAYDYGGKVYEGKGSYRTIELAFQDLEKNIQPTFRTSKSSIS
jgi:hypothetical protein